MGGELHPKHEPEPQENSPRVAHGCACHLKLGNPAEAGCAATLLPLRIEVKEGGGGATQWQTSLNAAGWLTHYSPPAFPGPSMCQGDAKLRWLSGHILRKTTKRSVTLPCRGQTAPSGFRSRCRTAHSKCLPQRLSREVLRLFEALREGSWDRQSVHAAAAAQHCKHRAGMPRVDTLWGN